MSRFDAARRAALMGDLLGHLAGRPSLLLPFEEVRRNLGLRHLVNRGLQQVPLDRIVGTLGRAREFSRAFLPRRELLRDRWQQIERLLKSPGGFPPVDLYQVGETYFVVDGHHRISVLRSLKAPSVEARVQEFVTPVPLPPEASLEDVLLRRGLADFLEATGLEPTTPNEFVTTEPRGYERLLEHVQVHGYFLGLERQAPVPPEEAVTSWYQEVYRPRIEIIRQSQIVDAFPKRTETDLYLFTMDHLHELRNRYGDAEVDPGEAVEDFEKKHRRDGRRGLRGLFGGAGRDLEDGGQKP